MRWRLEIGLVRALMAILALIPHRTRLTVGRSLGVLLFRADRKHRAVALQNLALAFPGADAGWRADIARRSFENLGRLFVEVLSQWRERDAVVAATEVEGWEHVERYARSRTGYFLMSGHFGNWERVHLVQGSRGFPVVMVARPLDNPHLERLLAATRQAAGNRIVHKRSAIKETVKALKDGHPVAFVIDQDFPEAGPHFVPFFGTLASTTPALGSIATRMNVPVLPVFAFPRPDGSYKIVYGPPLAPVGVADGEAAAVAVTAEATRRIEEAVRACPEAWLWMHDRWRTRPLDEPI